MCGVAVVAVAFLATACGASTEPVDAGGIPTASSTTSSVSTSPTPSSRPVRPKDIDLTAIVNCSKVANLPVTQWKVGAGKPFSNPAGSMSFPGATTCYWGRLKTAYSLQVELVRDVGAFEYKSLDQTPHREELAKGYTVIVLSPTQFPDRCQGLIDVHDGQLVSLDYATDPKKPAEPQAALCERLPDIATATLTALSPA
jgi:hypothetical protein